ncbi:MAG: bifunctional nicotinamidase/pyrazinamidase [Alphaproteobacteria bacterium]
MIKLTNTDLLLVIDVQNDFCPNGALAVPDGDAIVSGINDLLEIFPNRVFTQDWHPTGHSSFASSHADGAPFGSIDMPYGPQTLWPDHCIQGSKGAEFHQNLKTEKAQAIIRKGTRPEVDSYSAFVENDQKTLTGLSGLLSTLEIERVFLTGLATDFCVGFSALDAVKFGFETYVVEDLCRAIDLDGSLDTAYDKFKASGIHCIKAVDIQS